MGQPDYPFEPKSNAYLRPGDYWALPLRDGRYGAGRVLAVPAFGPKDRVGVVIGLLDWVGGEPPTAAEIGGRRLVATAKGHIDAIRRTGGQVLGNRSLEADGIEPPRETFQISERTSVWGWKTIVNRAEQQFLDTR